jgi:hypothetical protein
MASTYLCYSGAATCSSGLAHRSSPAYLALHCGTSEGAIKLGLEHGGVLPGFSEFFLQSFRSKHRIAIPLEHVRLLSGSLHDILHKATNLTWVLIMLELDYSRVQSRTFIHYSTHRIDSKLRATAVGLIRSSARSSSPSD